HFRSDDLGGGGLSHARRTHQKGMIELATILLGAIECHDDLFDNRGLADQLPNRAWASFVDVTRADLVHDCISPIHATYTQNLSPSQKPVMCHARNVRQRRRRSITNGLAPT